MRPTMPAAAAAAAITLAAAGGLAAPAAAAVPSAEPGAVTAVTQISDRGDSGGGGTWAADTITRVLTIRLTGRLGGRGVFSATVADTGTFTTIAGALTPDQGGEALGQKIAAQLPGTLAGHASYSFTASTLPAASLVPAAEQGTPASGPATTSRWYMQAFPPGTVFGGPGLLPSWSWSYAAVCPPAWNRWPAGVQRWTDAAANDGGQDAGAGNITGRCLPPVVS